MTKLNYLDEEAIREFEQDTMDRELKKLEDMHKEYVKKNPHANIVPWRVYFEQHKEEIESGIKEKYRFEVL